jgi:murein DD-endopeptidase MepM/ murein hydrolase activator NlpD
MGLRQKKRRGALALLMGLLLVGGCFLPTFGAGATTSNELKSQIEQLEESASQLEKRRNQLASALKDLRADKAQAMERKQNLEQQMELLREDIANSDRLLTQYAAYLQAKEAELSEAEEREAQQYQLFCQRVRAMEEAGSVSYWSVLFSAKDFSGFLDNVTMISEIMEYDNAVMDLLVATREEIDRAKAELEEKQAAELEVRDRLSAQRRQLQEQAAQVDQLVEELSADEARAKEDEAAMLAEAAEIDRQIEAKERELEAKIQAGTITVEPGGDYLWPLPGNYRTIWSLFGGRTDPITGKPANHNGIDVAAPKNTPIYAARGGVVLTSTYYGSYGNYVTLSHGDGTSTLYAHMNSRAVKEGETVKQGDVIGYVGTTGRSKGNHLHLEVRINGRRQDPVDFYPGLTLYYRNDGKTVLLEH